MFPQCKLDENEVKDYLLTVDKDRVYGSLNKERLGFTDFINLLSPAASEMIEDMEEVATKAKRMHFGKTIRLYSPLYISNYCINDCKYCGFRTHNSQERRRLTIDELVEEAATIREYGIDSLLLVSGEDPKAVSIDYLEEAANRLKEMFSFISIEIYPLDEAGYKRLFKAGVHGLTLYQETYNQKLYKELHTKGPKSVYSDRLDAVEAGGKAGFYNIGLGTLLGLYDWRIEAVSMAAHALWLRKRFWKTKTQFSFPRITPIEGGFDIPAPVSQEKLYQSMLAFRIFFQEADLYLSTRESVEFRDKAALTCATHFSAASRVIPGGYCNKEEEDLGQFTLNDCRSVEQIHKDLKEIGLEAVYKDWDPCMG
jgi:2-iminoacetate synthase